MPTTQRTPLPAHLAAAFQASGITAIHVPIPGGSPTSFAQRSYPSEKYTLTSALSYPGSLQSFGTYEPSARITLLNPSLNPVVFGVIGWTYTDQERDGTQDVDTTILLLSELRARLEGAGVDPRKAGLLLTYMYACSNKSFWDYKVSRYTFDDYIALIDGNLSIDLAAKISQQQIDIRAFTAMRNANPDLNVGLLLDLFGPIFGQ